MQVKAILRAALRVNAEGIAVLPEIMVPLVACWKKSAFSESLSRPRLTNLFAQEGRPIAYRVGVMIEVPRAAACAK